MTRDKSNSKWHVEDLQVLTTHLFQRCSYDEGYVELTSFSQIRKNVEILVYDKNLKFKFNI